MNHFHNSFLILIAIFLAVFLTIIVARLIFTFLLHLAYKRYLAAKRIKDKIVHHAKKRFIKEDEELLRKKDEIPKANSILKAEARAKQNKQASGSYELVESDEQRMEKEELSEVKIVDIVKPIGFWTSVILGQKLTYLIQSAQVINKRGKQGFWVSMIEAKERASGRQHGRGR